MNSTQHAPQKLPRCVAGVLVGGGSRRMGASKALLRWDGEETFVERTVRTASAVAEEVCLLGHASSLPASLDRLTVLPDAAENAGPLAGLAALLGHARERWTLLLACDMPVLDRTILERLLAHAGPEVDAVAYVVRGDDLFYEAACALYHPRAINQVQACLASGERGLQRVLRGLRVARLEPTDAECMRLSGVNTPDELDRLRQAWGGESR